MTPSVPETIDRAAWSELTKLRAADGHAPTTHTRYEAHDAERAALTAAGLSRELSGTELARLRVVRNACEAYLDWVFGPQPAKPQPAKPVRRGNRWAHQMGGRIGRLIR